ncbi:DUF1648 domain-containing protein [Fredinandcohnia quinoae]|uniref:DUF1648 domain-containing protein n=1 Tax=Fredinandcohnia quinoae TaxID=2918902 RepID=A0AAW5E632_9BACI|nr:DUF1648 domain-containing protein [Fredinandcohnia sp. SECRCQ15]MCH1626984.1 DUF1648 domain-containing protein [Fredinandcohnia sp. SECRCQ15]
MFNEKQPKIFVPKTTSEKVMDTLSILIIIGAFAYIASIWRNLPDQVPSHFNAMGEPDDWSGKGMIFLLPVIGTVIFFSTFVVSRFPQLFNYPVKVTKENAERLYVISRKMLTIINFELVIFFAIGTWEIVEVAHGGKGLGIWYLPVFLVVIFGTIGYYMYRTFKLR